QATGIGISILAKSSDALASDVPTDVRARIDAALADGNVVVALQRPITVAGTKRFAWWQIDPRSGHTIPVTDEGLHQATAEISVDTDGTYLVEIRLEGQFIRSERFASQVEAYGYAGSLQDFLAARDILLAITVL